MNDIYKMFGNLTVWELRSLLHTIVANRLHSHVPIYEELEAQESGRTKGSQFKFLNKSDLLELIYSSIIDDIKTIDCASVIELKDLLTWQWCCPQLKDRIRYRLAKKE